MIAARSAKHFGVAFLAFAMSVLRGNFVLHRQFVACTYGYVLGEEWRLFAHSFQPH